MGKKELMTTLKLNRSWAFGTVGLKSIMEIVEMPQLQNKTYPRYQEEENIGI